ncbi:MAG: hypothetical protein HY238_04335 [Acidobacteria bacterium]|nr:hypothetical protein [Acidobacteriota bacterium]
MFPQLGSGAVSQFPVRRETGYRTLVNRALDGSEIRVQDLDFLERQWELELESLSDGEWQAIRDLFAAVEGRLKTFLFLEPGENLLAWSEKFTEAVWVASGVTVAEGIADPLGGTAASELSGAGTLSQPLGIPAQFRYAASIWARATQAGAGFELNDGAGQRTAVGFSTDGQWRRYTLSTAWTGVSETVVFRVTAPAAIYGAQLEAQPAASAYKKTMQQGGVHPAARLSTDSLEDRMTGPGQHSGVIRISWTPLQT